MKLCNFMQQSIYNNGNAKNRKKAKSFQNHTGPQDNDDLYF